MTYSLPLSGAINILGFRHDILTRIIHKKFLK
jgi:hypothetical protein